MIAYAAYNVKAMRANIDSIMQNSFVFPILVETGSVIMKLDPIEISNDINKTIQKGTEALQEGVSNNVKDSTIKIIDDTANKITQNVEQNLSHKEER